MTDQKLFVLESLVALPGFMDPPSPLQRYDSIDQLWRWIDSGLPVVQEERFEASRHGETILTCTSEGIDQSEGSQRRAASDWGETVTTRTSEGVDQSESSRSLRSSYGEIIVTKTSKELDQPERSDIATNTH